MKCTFETMIQKYSVSKGRKVSLTTTDAVSSQPDFSEQIAEYISDRDKYKISFIQKDSGQTIEASGNIVKSTVTKKGVQVDIDLKLNIDHATFFCDMIDSDATVEITLEMPNPYIPNLIKD